MTTVIRRRRTDRLVEPRARNRHRLVERQSTTDLAKDRAERLLLAEMLMEPGRQVAVLNAGNQVDRWTTLEEVVACDEPFFIRAGEDVLILDVDHRDQHPALNELTNLLRSWRCTPVVVASGQRHHRHLFCWIPSRPHLEHLRERARQAGIDTRPSRDIRPPLAPHRLGRVPRLLAPATIDACVAALSSAPDTWPDIDGPDRTPSRGVRSGHDEPTAPGALSARMQRLLRDGDTEGRYASGSEVAQALVTSMRSNDWSFDEIEQVLSDPANSGGMSLQERQEYKSQRIADVWLRRCVERADDLLITANQDRNRVALLRRTVLSTFAGRTGATDHKVYECLLKVADDIADLTVNMSRRQLAETAGIADLTAARALKRLVAQGLLEVIESRPGQPLAATYHLVIPASAADGAQSGPPPSHPLFLPGIGMLLDPGHDVWRNGSGLGSGAYRIYGHLQQQPFAVNSRQAPASPLPRSQRQHLRTLEAAGLVQCDQDGIWRPVEVSAVDVDALAASLESHGRGERQRRQHHLERQTFKKRSAQQHRSRKWRHAN